VTRLQQALVELSEDLQDLGVRWALVGGLALAAHVEARTTRDLEDAQLLLSIADQDEITRARRGVDLISERDYGRDQDLAESFSRLLGGSREASM